MIVFNFGWIIVRKTYISLKGKSWVFHFKLVKVLMRIKYVKFRSICMRVRSQWPYLYHKRKTTMPLKSPKYLKSFKRLETFKQWYQFWCQIQRKTEINNFKHLPTVGKLVAFTCTTKVNISGRNSGTKLSAMFTWELDKRMVFIAPNKDNELINIPTGSWYEMNNLTFPSIELCWVNPTSFKIKCLFFMTVNIGPF